LTLTLRDEDVDELELDLTVVVDCLTTLLDELADMLELELLENE